MTHLKTCIQKHQEVVGPALVQVFSCSARLEATHFFSTVRNCKTSNKDSNAIQFCNRKQVSFSAKNKKMQCIWNFQSDDLTQKELFAHSLKGDLLATPLIRSVFAWQQIKIARKSCSSKVRSGSFEGVI